MAIMDCIYMELRSCNMAALMSFADLLLRLFFELQLGLALISGHIHHSDIAILWYLNSGADEDVH